MPITDKPCQFCGRTLKARTAPLFGRPVFFGYEECDCEGAQHEREIRERERAEVERRERNKRLMARYEQAGIPPLFLERRRGCEEVYGSVRKTASAILDGIKDGRGAYLVGGVGTRKTLVAATAARYAIDDGIHATFTTASKVLDAVRGSYGTSKDSQAVMDAYCSAKVLVLDDLGKESPTDWTLMKLFELVNDRYEHMRPLIITTQYQRGDLIQRLAKNGDYETAVAIVSRLAETCDRYDFSGPDRRLNG